MWLGLILAMAGSGVVAYVVARVVEAAAQSRGAARARRRAEDLRALMRDLEELSERCAAEADARAAALQHLIAAADQRLAELEASAAAPPGPPGALAPPGPGVCEPVVLAGRDRPDPALDQVYQLAEQGLSPLQIAKHLGRPPGQVELILALRRG